MLRILTLSTLFPDAGRPNFGVFVERQTIGLAAHPDVELKVMAPLGVAPWPLSRHALYAARRALPRREIWKGLDVLRPLFPTIPGVGGRSSPALMARTLLPILKDLRKTFAFDVIDAEFFYPEGPAAMKLSRALGIPFSIKARGSDVHYWQGRPGCREALVAAGRAADGLLAVSGALRDDMAALGIPRDRIRVHHTGVDLAQFRPSPDRQAAKAALGVDGPLILSVGYLIERKGQRLVVEAMKALPDATLLIVGEGPDRAVLEAMIATPDLHGRVRLLGSQPHAELPRLFAAADVMALPSASEGLANVWVEALACGTPIVISDVGGAREVVDRPEAGRLAARDVGAIAAAIGELLHAPPDPQSVRAAALRFTWEANTASLYAHLSGLVRPKS